MSMKLSTQEARKFFEQMYQDNVLIMLFMEKQTHRIISSNNQAQAFYGYPQDELANLFFTDLCVTDPDDDPQLLMGLNGQLVHFEITQRVHDGQLKFVEVYATETGFARHNQLLFIIIDATERQQTEKQLRDAQSRYRIIANFNHDWEYWMTPDGLFGYMSPSCERITGYTAEEFLHNPDLLNQIIVSDDQTTWREHLDELGEDSKKPRTITEFRIQHRNNEIIWIEHVSQIIIDENGLYLGHRASNRDITSRKQIEKELKEKTEILQLAVETSDMGVWEWDIPNDTIKYEKNWAQLFGYTMEEIEPTNTIWARLVHPQDKQRSLNQINKVIAGILPRLEVEQRLQSRTGEWRWVMTRGTVVERLPDGSAKRFVGLDIDITNRKKNQEDAFQFELERQRVDVLASFMQSAKHEFKTPLSRINMKLYLLRRAQDEAKRDQIAGDIEAQVSEIDNLIESMMLMARLDTVSNLPNAFINLRDILTTLIADFAGRVEESQLHFTSDLPQYIPKLRGNTSDLYEALNRVLDNAVRYTPPSGHISLSLKVTNSNVLIEVHNTGPGISKEALPHIFERFFREDKAHTTSGIGLGLPIAKRIIEQHYGNMRIASEPDIGTTVQIRLPIRIE